MPGTPIRVLIVDDEPSLLRMMRLYLDRKGFSVVAAERVENARAEVAAAAEGFHVVVLDASLRGAALDELAREFLNGGRCRRLLAVSGYPVDMERLEAAAPGRVAFLHKPFTGDMLAEAVRRLLGAEEESL